MMTTEYNQQYNYPNQGELADFFDNKYPAKKWKIFSKLI